MRLLGLDFGGRTVGVAISDPTGQIATELTTVRRKYETHLRETYRKLGELISQHQITGIVLGYPLHMDGSIGDRAEKTLAFKEELEKRFSIPVFLSDERLTSVEAETQMREHGAAPAEIKERVDQVAAAIILQQYLNDANTAHTADVRKEV